MKCGKPARRDSYYEQWVGRAPDTSEDDPVSPDHPGLQLPERAGFIKVHKPDTKPDFTRMFQ